MSDRPVAFAGDGFEIVAHESAPTSYPDERHPTIQICVPLTGALYNVTREADTGAVFTQDLGARDILIVPAGQQHAVHWLRRAGIVSLQISECFVRESLDVSRLTLPDFLTMQDRLVTVAAAELYSAMSSGEPISPLCAEALVVSVAQRVAFASQSDVRKLGVVRRLTPMLLRRIEHYIDDNLERQIALSELALVAGLSRWYFLRVFRATVGTSPNDYVMRRRLDRARNLLRTSSRSVMDIASEVGMTHSHFSRAFSRRLGVTPTEFRRISRQ